MTKIALVGPLADSRNNMLGTWAPTGNPELAVTILEGFKNVAPKAEIRMRKEPIFLTMRIWPRKLVKAFGLQE